MLSCVSKVSAAGYIDDSKIAEITELSIVEVRDSLENLEGKRCVERSLAKVVKATQHNF